MRYVTYDEAGNLTGCYLQDVLDEHAGCHIEVDEQLARCWAMYRANSARDDVELAPAPAVDLALEAVRMSEQVDTLVANIYARPQRFIAEYEQREDQARAFLLDVQANPSEPVPPRIAAFAAAAGLSAAAAATLTVQQADGLRAALGLLADLRMRKYEIQRAADLGAMQAVFNDIIAKVVAVGKTIG